MLWKTADYAGWGRVHTARGQIARPERAAQLAQLMEETPAPAMGMRRSYNDSLLNDGGRIIDMTRMDKILAFDPETGVVEVEAGMQIGELVRLFAPRGWIPAVVPGTGFPTVGGAIAHDIHGKNHHVLGSFGQHVLSVTLLQPGGGRVVASPARNKTLFRATMGGIGQTGVILSARLQMIATPGTSMRVKETRVENFDEFLALLDASTFRYNVGWIDGTATGAAMGRGILEEAELTDGPQRRALPAVTVPLDLPSFALSAPTVKLFNAAYWRKVPSRGNVSVMPIAAHVFPLDKLYDWNRLYGKRGFHQFQCVVPVENADVLKQIVAKISRSGLASPLAVIKRMGEGRAGMLSFPMEGYTLAIDFPAREKAEVLIAELEAMTVEAGGRLYLGKDALASGATIKAMYPEWEAWAAEAEKADPEGLLITDMVRRLHLRGTA
ncbi:FAD-binding oxidoreductase [Sinisalibacter lacisalsi]|uniref:Oxidoreductase n=1 Tax=Sinisalibacter lacisalsi TaxID=1526570 RepID=A0ABQ1QSF4_9RHOB|nr:FAD-binding oxidoreductase [Sinisalibacter lacisalsi]GGD39911.1 oxidoreductase [Sinisalibacter lacisalsi]